MSAVPEYCPGFAEVSAFLSMEDEKEGGLYRRFRQLSTRNIMYMQAELAALEARLLQMDVQDAAIIGSSQTAEKVKTLQCGVDWETLVRQSSSEGREKQRIELIFQIREMMKTYHKAVLLDSQIAGIPSPHSLYLETFRKFVQLKNGGINMRGPQLDEVSPDEYLVTYTRSEVDRLTAFISDAITKSDVSFLKAKRRVPPSWQSLYFYSDDLIEKVVAVIAVMLSAGLLIGGIAALDYVDAKRKGARLGILAAFTISFAVLVGLLTNARKAELYAATAGFTAVLVVYVGSAS